MDFLALLGGWLKGQLKIQAHQLKGAPGVHDPEAAAEHVNAIVGGLIDTHISAHSNGAGEAAGPPAPVSGIGSLEREAIAHRQEMGW